MAITAIFDMPGVTKDQYDGVIKHLEQLDLAAPDGRLFHVSSPTDKGWFVCDVWESPEKLQAFAGKLIPIAKDLGFEPVPVVVPVHNLITG